MTNKEKKEKFDMGETFKQGVGGGILGAFVGAPGLGMGLGMLHANKNQLKQWGKDVDNNMTFNEKVVKSKNPTSDVCPQCGYKPCKCRVSARDNPAAFLMR